jgi:hypothetical protein
MSSTAVFSQERLDPSLFNARAFNRGYRPRLSYHLLRLGPPVRGYGGEAPLSLPVLRHRHRVNYSVLGDIKEASHPGNVPQRSETTRHVVHLVAS